MSSPVASAYQRKLRAAASFLVLSALFFASIACAGQKEATAGDENATMTLHVYTNLIQIPVLILGPYLDYVPKIDPGKLTVSLDHETPFHPVHVRPEGDDPISLAILLDLSEDRTDLLPEFADAFAKMAVRSLHPQDEVAIYAVDCKLIRASDFAPPDPDKLRLTVTTTVTAFKHDRKHPRECDDSVHLLDALAISANRLSQRGGRRVILAISRGVDNGSVYTEDGVHDYTTSLGAAIFGLSPSSSDVGFSRGSHGYNSQTSSAPSATTYSFQALCQATGGIERRTSINYLDVDLVHFIKTVRERTIIEFPRPKDVIAGTHSIVVTLGKSHYFIRPSGISVPIADPRILNDPTTIRPEDYPSVPPPPTTATPPH
jgi:hypothetical protein